PGTRRKSGQQRTMTVARSRRPTVRGRRAAARRGSAAAGVGAAAGLVHALFWLSRRTHWLVPLFNDTVHRYGPGADFFALYQAGYSARHGQSIYTFLSGRTVIPYAYPFRYLPAVAYTAGSLLTLAPPAAAYALWLGICELCLLY